MIYRWESPKYCFNRLTGVYDNITSPSYFFFKKGRYITAEEFARCNLYVRSQAPIPPDDPFIREVLRHQGYAAYVFTADEMFYFRCMLEKVNISSQSLMELKAELGLTIANVDQPPHAATDEELRIINSYMDKYKYSRIPIITFADATREQVRKAYDCLPNSSLIPLVNKKTEDLLLQLAPDDVQFFDTEIRCKDGILPGYRLLNATHTIKGIDYAKSEYKKSSMGIITFRYMAYKHDSDCMGSHKIAREEDYIPNLVVSEEIKEAFARERIRGPRFVTPEEFYRPLRPSDLVD